MHSKSTVYNRQECCLAALRFKANCKVHLKCVAMAVFMLETLRLSKTLKSSRDDFNVLDNFNVSSIKTANVNFQISICQVSTDT